MRSNCKSGKKKHENKVSSAESNKKSTQITTNKAQVNKCKSKYDLRVMLNILKVVAFQKSLVPSIKIFLNENYLRVDNVVLK